LLRPELFNDSIDRKQLVPVDEEEREKRARTRLAERERTAVCNDLEWAEQPELHEWF
jgi:hypothetical protein